MSKVIKDPILTDAECDFCGHSWIACLPYGANEEKLECPKCGTMNGRFFPHRKSDREER